MAIKTEKFQIDRASSSDRKNRTSCRLRAQHVLRRRRQTLDSFGHVCYRAGKVYSNARSRSDHADSTARISRVRVAPFTRYRSKGCDRRSISLDEPRRVLKFPPRSVFKAFMSTGTNTAFADRDNSPFSFSSLRQV